MNATSSIRAAPAPDNVRPAPLDHEVVIVGLGFAGMYALHCLREQGFDVHAFEAADGPGGCWYWNRYPGARCDVPSLSYSYSFSEPLQQEWQWTEKYAGQPEILAYANHVMDRFELRSHSTFGTRVVSAVFDDQACTWTVTLDNGRLVVTRFLIAAVGALSTSRIPQWPGQSEFSGQILHTGEWPHEPVDFTGKRVGVIGTGSSGIQIIPKMAQSAEQVVVFQRTANFSVPARNAPLSDDEQAQTKSRYGEIRQLQRLSFAGAIHPGTGKSVLEAADAERSAELESRWQAGGTAFMAAYNDILFNDDSNALVADFVRSKIQEIVTDPVTAEKLTPKGHPIGAKRICVDTEYFDTFNRPNVDLVDVNADPITGFGANGIRTQTQEFALDAVVFATGYDAMTGSLTRLGIVGAGGVSLKQAWSAGPRTYLGVAVNGFPNLLIATGPGSPSVMVNGVMAGEQHAQWFAELLAHLREQGATRIEAKPEDQQLWVDHVNEAASKTLFPKANSWYMGANIPGKPRMFMPYTGGMNVYNQKCADVAADNYAGFEIS